MPKTYSTGETYTHTNDEEDSPDDYDDTEYRSSYPGVKEFVKQFNEIKQLLACPENKEMLKGVNGKDIVIFIGNTKSGKSTLVNYVIGNELIAVPMEDNPGDLEVVKSNNNEEGPIIGLESVSETTLPSIWSATKSGLSETVVDAPGFEDNRGVSQDIANTFYITEIIRNSKSVKFVLISDINDIKHHSINNFTNFIDKMHVIFPDTKVLYGGIALVLSKERNNISVGQICSTLNKKILNQKKMKVEKLLIKYFVDNKACITFFKMPAVVGPLCGSDIGRSIVDVIKNEITGIPGKRLSNVKPALSHKSLSFLHQSHAEFCNGGEYFDLLKKLQECFENKCKGVSQINSKEEHEEMEKVVNGLEMQFLELFPQYGEDLNFKNLIEKLTLLCYMCGIKKLMDESNIEVQLKFVEFLDQILNIDNGKIYFNQFQGTTMEIKSHFSEIKLALAVELNKIRLGEIETLRREKAEQQNQDMRERAEQMEVEMLRRDLDEATKQELRTKARAEEEKLRKELDEKTQEELRITNALLELERTMRKMSEEHIAEMKKLVDESNAFRRANERKIAEEAEELRKSKKQCNIL